MENINTDITSYWADEFFGTKTGLGTTFDATTRYISMKNYSGTGNVNLISCYTDEAYEGKDGNFYAQNSAYEITIITTSSRSSSFTVDMENWVALNSPPFPVAAFLSRFSQTTIYINEKIEKALIFVKNKTLRWIDALCSCLFRILPWRFKNGVSDEDTALFKAINQDDSDTFNTIINNFCKQFDFKSNLIKEKLIGWGKNYKKQRLKNLDSDSKSYMTRITGYESDLRNLIKRYLEIQEEIATVQAQPNSITNEVYDFFKNHKSIDISRIYKSGSAIDFNTIDYFVSDTIEYYDQSAFERMYNNDYSCIGEASPQIRQILFAIFMENKGAIRVEAGFRLTDLTKIEALKHARSGDTSHTHLAHPHITHFACLGGNEQHIRSGLLKGDWDLALEQTIAATKNLNFGDATVIEYFINDLTDIMDFCRCIIADNGEEMTPAEFLTYINKEKTSEETTNG